MLSYNAMDCWMSRTKYFLKKTTLQEGENFQKKRGKRECIHRIYYKRIGFPPFCGFQFFNSTDYFFSILHAFETFSREFWDNKGTIYRNKQTENNSLLRKQLCFWCLVSLKHKKKLQCFFYMKKTKNQKVAIEEGSYFCRRCLYKVQGYLEQIQKLTKIRH